MVGTLAELAGARTWSAHECDGTPVSVAYHVTADGTVVVDSTNPTTATVKVQDNGFRVRFDGTNVGLDARLKDLKDGTWALKVSGHSGQCGGHDQGHSGQKTGTGDHHGNATNARTDRHGQGGHGGQAFGGGGGNRQG